MTDIDPRLQTVANILRPGFAAPIIFQLTEPPQPARARELEAHDATVHYVAKFVPQLHADFPVNNLNALQRSGIPGIARFDEPTYAFQDETTDKKPINPLRSDQKEIEERIANRLKKTTPAPKPNPHYRTYLGAQGPVMVPMEAKTFTLQDVRAFTRSDKIYDEGATGRNVKVAVIDTGVDSGHPMLEGKVIKALSFVPEEAGVDLCGHGSWCASAIAGKPTEYNGRVKALQGKTLQGMSEADIIDIKVLTGEGSGAQSGIVQGIEAAVTEGANLLSMSLGSLFDGGGLTPDAQAVDEAVRRGIPAAVAVGNQFAFGAVGSPASARNAIAVGACAMVNPAAGAVASFSSKGPTRTGAVRPHISAPGGQLGHGIDETILGATSGVIATEAGEPYGLLRGSSMATPVVAGIIAQLLPLGFPKDRGRIEEVLAMGTRAGPSRPLGGSAVAYKDNRNGWGTIDALRMRDALGRQAPPGVKVAAQVQASRDRPFLSVLARAASGLRARKGQHAEMLRLTLV
jgi:subtilisin family serine protease